jgi:predicted DsbA family dithiol-disulfide isomerase
MHRPSRPLQVLVYQDVLCAWCFIADQRLHAVQRELGDQVRFRVRPFPLRVHEALPSTKELAGWVKDVTEARKEPEGAALSDGLWTAGDPPRSSVPALAALEAAQLQGGGARHALARALQRAALEQGVNVTRTDVVFEVASQVGLEMNRFSAAFQSPETRRLILEEHRIARERGVRGVPTVVIGGRWMICGLREVAEYRDHILGCLHKVERDRGPGPNPTLH